MDHLLAFLKDYGPLASTVAFAVVLRVMHKANRATNSWNETRFKADEAHEYVCGVEPEFSRRFATWKAHR